MLCTTQHLVQPSIPVLQFPTSVLESTLQSFTASRLYVNASSAGSGVGVTRAEAALVNRRTTVPLLSITMQTLQNAENFLPETRTSAYSGVPIGILVET